MYECELQVREREWLNDFSQQKATKDLLIVTPFYTFFERNPIETRTCICVLLPQTSYPMPWLSHVTYGRYLDVIPLGHKNGIVLGKLIGLLKICNPSRLSPAACNSTRHGKYNYWLWADMDGSDCRALHISWNLRQFNLFIRLWSASVCIFNSQCSVRDIYVRHARWELITEVVRWEGADDLDPSLRASDSVKLDVINCWCRRSTHYTDKPTRPRRLLSTLFLWAGGERLSRLQ